MATTNPATNYCKLPNAVIDVIMPNCSPSAFVIFTFIFRKSAGWGKVEAKLSYQQITNGTGIKGRATISKALRELETNGYIFRNGERRGLISYGVIIPPDIDHSSSENELDKTEHEPKLVQKMNQTDQSSSETVLDEAPPSTENEPDKPSSSSETELHLVQKLNTLKDNKRHDISSNAVALLDDEVGAPDFSALLKTSIKKIKVTLKPIEHNLTAEAWQTLISLETQGKNRQTLLEFFESRANPPPAAVNLYREILHRYPNREFWDEIDKTVGSDQTALDRWRQTLTEYAGAGWNPANVIGQLRFFREGMSPRNEVENGHRNTQSTANGQTTGQRKQWLEKYIADNEQAVKDHEARVILN